VKPTIACNPLPSEWIMVVADAIDMYGSYQPLSDISVPDRQPLEKKIISLIQELHDHDDGYVAGFTEVAMNSSWRPS